MEEKRPPVVPYTVRVRDSFSVLMWLVATHAACLSPFLRRRMGYASLAWTAPLAMFVAMPLIGGLSGRLDMFVYEFAWLLAVIYQRIKADKGRHSKDAGDPALAMRLLRCGPRLGYAAEPFIALFAGLAIYQVSEVVGLFVMAGVASLGADYLMDMAAQAARRVRLRDTAIEQRLIAEDFKNDRW